MVALPAVQELTHQSWMAQPQVPMCRAMPAPRFSDSAARGDASQIAQLLLCPLSCDLSKTLCRQCTSVYSSTIPASAVFGQPAPRGGPGRHKANCRRHRAQQRVQGTAVVHLSAACCASLAAHSGILSSHYECACNPFAALVIAEPASCAMTGLISQEDGLFKDWFGQGGRVHLTPAHKCKGTAALSGALHDCLLAPFGSAGLLSLQRPAARGALPAFLGRCGPGGHGAGSQVWAEWHIPAPGKAFVNAHCIAGKPIVQEISSSHIGLNAHLH